MHGLSSGSTFLVNAEVDSMGGVVEGGVGIGNKPSPCRAAIEKAQAELRLEYDVREERRRELEFLEKGGNPLDFKLGHGASVSVQSTSHTYQHPDQILTSEAKGSFALTASPRGDSVESSGRLGVSTACEPNSADNFDGENEILDSERKPKNPNGTDIMPSEHYSQLVGSHNNVRASENSPIFHPKKGQAYRRRNRSRPNRDAARSSSNDMASRGGPNSWPGQHAILPKQVASDNQFDIESNGSRSFFLSTTSKASEISEGKVNILIPKDQLDELHNASVKAEGVPCYSIEQKEGNPSAPQLDESGKINGDLKSTPSNARISNVVGLENTKIDFVTSLKNVDENGPSPGEKSTSVDNEMLVEKLDTNPMESGACFNEDRNFICQRDNGFTDKDQEVDKARISSRDEVECHTNVKELGVHDHPETKTNEEFELCDASVPKVENSCPVRQPSSVDPSFEVKKSDSCAEPLKLQTSSESQQKQVDKAQEERVLEEARIIEAKQKRIEELSAGLMPRENRQKSQWDFVLEEMVWLANDFTQERVWKMTAAAQISHHAAFASRLGMEKQSKCWKQKTAAQILAKDVMEFWHSASLCVGNDTCSQPENCKLDVSSGVDEPAHGKGEPLDPDKNEGSVDELKSLGKKQNLAIFGYAVRFLQENCSFPSMVKVESSLTPDVVCDDISEVLWQDQLTEENLFYVVPLGAMETYRKSIESCLAEFESIQEEVDMSMYESTAEFIYQENDDEDGDNVYYQPASRTHENGRPYKKKQKSLKIYANRYGLGSGFGYSGVDSRNGTTLPSALIGKRSANNLLVGPIPTKKIRTAPRSRVISPFTPSKTDASSGDTNSFPDGHSTLHGPIFARGLEVDSPVDYDTQLTIDSAENPGKSKKKKFKNPGAYSGWPVDSAFVNDQKDHVRKRHDHQLESNGNSGFNVHHMKKPKIKHLENSLENNIPTIGSVASPVASQMSNMSSQNKIIKILGGREKRKVKGIKIPVGQPGSGNPWSSFEDQALIVLVHDMGPNWELISDAINNTLRFKCIFRNPQECKERHKNLMDSTPGDGADSAEDSGCSQPYPSTLPGIPKGSARQLFQQLQRPMEEDTIKSHFDKIIHIAKQLHVRKKQYDNQDLKQIAPVHGSHVVALSQVIPNNVNGVILTPLDLCDSSVSNQDAIPLGFQGLHAGGLSLSNQGASPSMHPPGGLNSTIQGLPSSPSMGMGTNLASQPSQFTNARDARYPVPRSTSLPIEEQQRLQQNSHMLPGRNVQLSNLSSGSFSGTDRGVRMLPGGNGVGLAGGTSRGMPISRPGLQGIASPSMLNSGSMVSSNVGGVPSNMNMNSGSTSGPGNTMFRSRDALHIVGPGQSSDHQRQILLPEASTSGVAPFSALSSGFTNQASSPPLQHYGASHHQQHSMPAQQNSHVPGGPHYTHLSGAPSHGVTPENQQTYLRLARQRLAYHCQLQSPSSSQPPFTPSSPNTHVSSQSSHQVPSQGLGQTPQSQRQRHQQSGRQHPQQRQQSQPGKLVKGMGKRDMLMHQNLPMDPSHVSRVTVNSGNQIAEKGEQTVHLMQSQGLYSGSSLNTIQPSKSSPLSQTSGHLQQKPYANSGPTTPKQAQQIPSRVGSSNPDLAIAVSSSPASTGMPPLSHQSQPVQLRATQPNRRLNSDPLTKSQPDNVQVDSQPVTVDSTSTLLISSSSSSTLHKLVQESLVNCVMTSTPTPSEPISSLPLTNSSGNETLPLVSEALGQRQQFQHQQSPLQNSSSFQSVLPKNSQHLLKQVDKSPQKVPQSQIQAGKSSVFAGIPNSGLE